MNENITGTVVADRYKVTGFLRPGRMGDLYVARRLDDDLKVAIKVLDPGLFTNAEAVGRFEREARVARAIDHPCTLKVLDFGRSDAGPYLVLEYVEGELLSDVIEEGPLAPERAAVITGRIALALEAAHQKGVVHRDLAPANVLVAKQDRDVDLVKVSDFGLARITEPDDDENSHEATLTAVGVRIGTPTYMAPEYIEEYELDHRADIYGLGVMLFEMLTGAPPFTGRPYKVMEAHVHEPMPKPSSKRPGVPAWLDDLVFRMTAKRPDQRFQSAAEVAEGVVRGLGRRLDVVEYRAPTAEKAPKRVEAPAPAVDKKDPILDHFLQQSMGQVSRNKGAKPPPKDRRFLVTRVAKESVAGRLGIEEGWWLHLPDEDKGALLDPRLWMHVVNERRWVFFSPDGADRIETVTSGIPIGCEVCRSAENVVAHYDPLLPEASALLDLWRQARWEDLEKLSQRTMTQQKASGGIGGNLFGRFMGGAEKRVLFDHPALLFHGIAQLETKRPQGHLEVTEFAAKYAAKWPNVYQALAQWYGAMHELKANSEPHARGPVLEKLADVVLREPLPMLVKRFVEVSGQPAPGPAWVGETFADYSMDSVDGKSTAKLRETLERMDESQLLAVCLLGGFRGTPDYDDFMHRFANDMAFFEPFLYGLHVVTTQQEPEIDRPEVYRGEGMVRASRIPFVVLHDYRAFVQRAIKPPAIPTIYLLDRRGTCVHQGRLTDCDLWEALVFAGRLRVERFRGRR